MIIVSEAVPRTSAPIQGWFGWGLSIIRPGPGNNGSPSGGGGVRRASPTQDARNHPPFLSRKSVNSGKTLIKTGAQHAIMVWKAHGSWAGWRFHGRPARAIFWGQKIQFASNFCVVLETSQPQDNPREDWRGGGGGGGESDIPWPRTSSSFLRGIALVLCTEVARPA